MTNILSIILLVFLPITALSAEYKAREFDRVTGSGSQFLELQIVSEDGKTFDDILPALNLSNDDLAIRILGVLPQSTKEELMLFYKQEIPGDLTKALKSKGNLHDPKISPLIMKFPDAFKRTVMFYEIENTLKERGYDLFQMEFEKFTIFENSISVPDIWLKFKKLPNGTN